MCEIFDEPFNTQSLFSVVFVLQGELMESSSDEEESGPQDEEQPGSVLDMEDLGHIINRVSKAKVCPAYHQETALHIFAHKYIVDIEI